MVNKRDELLQRIKDQGVNCIDEHGNSLLQEFIFNAYELTSPTSPCLTVEDIVEKCGPVDVDYQNTHWNPEMNAHQGGYTALHVAVNHNPSMVEYLLKKGSTPWLLDNGKTAFDDIKDEEGEEYRRVKYLLRTHTPRSSTSISTHSRTELYEAIRDCDPEWVQSLLDAGADVRHKDIHEMTPLHFLIVQFLSDSTDVANDRLVSIAGKIFDANPPGGCVDYQDVDYRNDSILTYIRQCTSNENKKWMGQLLIKLLEYVSAEEVEFLVDPMDLFAYAYEHDIEAVALWLVRHIKNDDEDTIHSPLEMAKSRGWAETVNLITEKQQIKDDYMALMDVE